MPVITELPAFLTNLPNIPANSTEHGELIEASWLNRTKIPGSLGRLEELATWMGSVQRTDQPTARFPALRLFGAAHGITAEGVTMCPEHVNPQMMKTIFNGGASINVLCRSNGIDFRSYDVGIDNPTANFMNEPAMTMAETEEALKAGWDSVPEFCDLFAVGEMGIGNTTPAAAILATILDLPVETITGRGAGLTDERLEQKTQVLKQALINRKSELTSPLNILAAVGGREIAAMTGAILRAASLNIPVVLDGVICAASAAIAFELEPKVRLKCIAGHRSVEPAHTAFIQHYDFRPIVELDMRLGEGTGAAVAMGIMRNAIDCYDQLATLEQAGVSLG